MLFITENVPASLRGELTRWMLQLKPGVFLGTLTSLVGEKLWNKIKEKQKDGGAVWVKATKNEQKFKLMTTGKTHWQITDFEGLQLITHPYKKSKRKIQSTKSSTIKEKKSKKRKEDGKIPEVTWDSEGIPPDFIIRKVKFKIQNSKITSKFTGNSAYGEYPPDKLWSKPWINDIKTIGKSLIRYISNIQNLIEESFYGKKIVCLDIETTDYLPKAYEGFINIIGLSILDLKNIKFKGINLKLFQAFNMTRKKARVPTLLELIKPYFNDVNSLLVFNQEFDIKILNTVIKEFSFDMKLPLNIIDLMDYFPNLNTLEDYLTTKTGIKRFTTEKGKYSDYYKLFKGKGKMEYNKLIEPIGTYNITDTLTPLYAYLLLNSKGKW